MSGRAPFGATPGRPTVYKHDGRWRVRWIVAMPVTGFLKVGVVMPSHDAAIRRALSVGCMAAAEHEHVWEAAMCDPLERCHCGATRPRGDVEETKGLSRKAWNGGRP